MIGKRCACFRKRGLDLALIVRLAASLILCIVGALAHSTVLRYMLLVLSVLAAGYDYLAAAIACILNRQVFRPAVIVIVCVIGTMAVGQPVDAAVFSARVPGRFDPDRGRHGPREENAGGCRRR